MSEPPPFCCICLDRFTSPAHLPCGHCFCLGCIGEYWRIHGACRCPLCQAFYPTRPRLTADQTIPAGVRTASLKAGEVPCDFCPVKRGAVKSCLRCMASYCAAHLEPHYQSEELGRHLLIGVAKNLEDSACRLHGRPLNGFCRSDRTCVCATCAQTEHRGHHIISINREAAKKKVKLKRKSVKLQQAIQERLSKIETLSNFTCAGEDPTEAASPASPASPAYRPLNKDLVAKLEEEISELQRRNAELEQLSETEDDLHFLQVWVTVESQEATVHPSDG